jgi:hypothetical protein
VDTLIFSKDVDENGNIVNCWLSKNKEINKLLKQEILINKIREIFYSNRKEIIDICVFYIFTKFIVRTTRINAPVLHKLFFNRF